MDITFYLGNINNSGTTPLSIVINYKLISYWRETLRLHKIITRKKMHPYQLKFHYSYPIWKEIHETILLLFELTCYWIGEYNIVLM